MLACRIKSERGSIQRQSFDEFLAKRFMTLTLIEDMNLLLRTAAVVNSGKTGSGFQRDTETMQDSPAPATLARVDPVGQNSKNAKIDSHLGDLRPTSQSSIS